MIFNPAYTETVDVLSPVMSSSPYSSELVEDWTTPTARTVYNVPVYAGTASETPAPSAPQQAVDILTAILPYGDPVKKTDRLKVRTGPHAGTYGIDGRPAHWRTPWTGWEAGCEVRLKEVSGG